MTQRLYAITGGLLTRAPDRLRQPQRDGTKGVAPLRLRQYQQSEWKHQTALVDCLRKFAHPDCLWFAVANQQDGGAQRGFFLRQMGTLAGVPDLVFLYPMNPGCLPPCVLFLELKTATGRQSDTQREFERRAKKIRAEYYVSHSLNVSLDLLWARDIITRDLTKQS